ncbi:hypothetical protein Tco_0499589 [Tanacetum coccineum]
MSSETKLTKDEDSESMENTKYRGMIGSLLYLTEIWWDIMLKLAMMMFNDHDDAIIDDELKMLKIDHDDVENDAMMMMIMIMIDDDDDDKRS